MALIAASEEVNIKDYKEKHTYYLLDESSDPCGYIIYSISNDDDAYLEAIYLENTYRGKRLGKEVLKQLEQELIKKSIKLIRLLVFAYNEPAFRLYKGMGYEIENSYFHEGKPISHRMTKKIL